MSTPYCVVASGTQLPGHIRRVLPILQPISGPGPLGSSFQIPVGTVDQRARMLILGMSGGEAVYVVNTEMRTCPVSRFLTGYLVGDVTSQVYARTAWIVPASKVMLGFMSGVLIGFFGTIGTVASVSVMVAKVARVALSNPNERAVLMEMCPIAWDCFKWFRRNCPMLYSKMKAIMERGSLEALCETPSGITGDEVAELLGRILGGIMSAGEKGIELSLKVMLKLATKTAGIFSGLHLVPTAMHGASHHSQKMVEAIADEFRQQGTNLFESEKKQIQIELGRCAFDAYIYMDRLKTALDKIQPALDRIVADLKSGQ